MKNPEKTEAIIFDLGRVLVDVDFSRILADFSGNPGIEKMDFNLVTAQPWCIKFNQGRSGPEEFYTQAIAYMGLDVPIERLRFLWTNIFKPVQGMEPILNKIAQHKKLGLLSDINVWHWSFIKDTFPFLKMFSNPALSFKIGEIKPHPHCYRTAVQAVGKRPGQCLFIDDKPENVQGAIDYGMQSWQFTSSENLQRQLQQTFPEMW